MKKIITLLSLVAVCSLTLKAQETPKKNEFRLSVADGSQSKFGVEIVEGFFGAIGKKISGESRERNHSVSLGAGYRRQLTDRIAVGGDVAYQRFEYYTSTTGSSVKKDISKINIIQVLPTLEFSYFRNDMINLYGTASAGLLYSLNKFKFEEDGKRVGFAYQVNPIGIKVGKKIGGFAEVGFGKRGIATAGLFYKF